jgi:hypothetical protein
VKTIEQRVAELLAEAPPLTLEQRQAAVRILAAVPPEKKAARRCSASAA